MEDIKTSGIGRGTPGPGRGKGTPNKLTKEFRDTVRKLLEENSENVGKWLAIVAEGDQINGVKPDPAKALDLLSKLADYAAPRMGRIEHVGDGGGPMQVAAVEWKLPESS